MNESYPVDWHVLSGNSFQFVFSNTAEDVDFPDLSASTALRSGDTVIPFLHSHIVCLVCALACCGRWVLVCLGNPDGEYGVEQSAAALSIQDQVSSCAAAASPGASLLPYGCCVAVAFFNFLASVLANILEMERIRLGSCEMLGKSESKDMKDMCFCETLWSQPQQVFLFSGCFGVQGASLVGAAAAWTADASSVAMLAQAISCSNVRGVLVLAKCPQPSFVVSHLFSWKVLTMGPMCLSLLCLVPLRIMVLLMVLALISTIGRSNVQRAPRYVVTTRAWIRSFGLQHWNRTSALLQNMSVLSLRAKLKRMRRPSPVDLDRQDHGTYLDIVTAPQPLSPLGPMAQGHLMTVEIRGVDLISSQAPKMNKHEVPFLLRFTCEQYHKGITKWINNLWEESNMPAVNKPVRLHCKAGSVSVRLVFETRAKCQDFIARCKIDGIPYAIDSPFCCTNTNIIVRQSKSIEDRDIGKHFAPLWRELADQLKVLFPDGDDEGAFIIPALDARSQVLSTEDRRNGIGKPVFKRASRGSGQTFTLVAPELSVLGVSPEVLQRVLSHANKVNV